ncbi:MAG: NTP transferase domain-containing protein [Candidatus Diapherotrites archaeon]|uniref:NTP transferase domain-containing protein n=1 Tax=Candidatus Iainarchaeum sp. TaxID=3101447 RepID=A0A938YMH2_9ARCH|nr:NTP transferase domain-containing protein [Candidatus Diapherotrites archaeon]
MRMETVAIVLAGGMAKRMEGRLKHLLPIPGNPEQPLTQTPLGRLILQLQNAGVGDIRIAAGENTKALQEYLAAHGIKNIPVFSAARQIGGRTDWKFVYGELAKQIKPGQRGLFVYGDNIYKDSTITALARRAKQARKPFEVFWSFDLIGKKGKKPGMVDETGWTADKRTLEGFAKKGNPFSRYKGVRYVRFLKHAATHRTGVRLSKPVINLNNPKQYQAAQRELKRRPWQVKTKRK